MKVNYLYLIFMMKYPIDLKKALTDHTGIILNNEAEEVAMFLADMWQEKLFGGNG